MLRQQYRDVAHEGYISHDATYHVFFPVQKLLACGIELGVVRRVVLLNSAGSWIGSEGTYIAFG
jgi:hypothetical protein